MRPVAHQWTTRDEEAVITLKEFAEAAAIYAPALGMLGLILRFSVKWLAKRHREIIQEEQEPVKTQLTAVEVKVTRVQERVEVINGSVAMVTDRAELLDHRVAAIENVERGKALAREEVATAAAIAKMAAEKRETT